MLKLPWNILQPGHLPVFLTAILPSASSGGLFKQVTKSAWVIRVTNLILHIDRLIYGVYLRALGNAELRVLGCKLFTWDAWFSPGGSSAYTCFFSRHVPNIQEREINTPREIKNAFKYRLRLTFQAAGDVCLCWPIEWLGLQWSNPDRWLTRLPMRGQCDY